MEWTSRSSVQTLSGNFAFEKAAAGGGGSVIRVAASEVTLRFSGGGSDVLALTDGAGSFVISTDGLAGRISGSVALTVPGVDFGVTLTVELNTTDALVDETFTVGGVETELNLEAGDYVRVVGTGVSLEVLGQRLSGDFTFEQSGGTVSFTVDDFALVFGDGSNDLITVSQGTASFVINDAGIDGTVSSTVTANIPGVTLGGTLTVEVDTTNPCQPLRPCDGQWTDGCNLRPDARWHVYGRTGHDARGRTVTLPLRRTTNPSCASE